jgi:hypothetical protein
VRLDIGDGQAHRFPIRYVCDSDEWIPPSLGNCGGGVFEL